MTPFSRKKSLERRVTVKQAESSRTERSTSAVSQNASVTLLRPHVTEKSGRLGEFNQYVFVVADRATKPQIARAIFEAYGVRPVRVSTQRIPGRRRRLGASQGFVSGYKKAIVSLPQGKTIEVLPK